MPPAKDRRHSRSPGVIPLLTCSAGMLLLVFAACTPEPTTGLTPPSPITPVTGPKEIRPASGNNQAGPAGTLLPAPIVARVYDSTGIPVPGVPVTWSADKGGQLIPEGPVTDSNGNARAGWILGDTAGPQAAIASSSVGDALFSSNALRTLARVSLTPTLVTLLPSGSQQFSVIGIFTDSSTGAVPVNYSVVPLTGGLITSGGLFTAGTTLGNYLIIATQVGGARLADSSTVNVVSGLASLQQIFLLPRAPTVAMGQTVQFSVTGRMDDGTIIVPNVFYTASGGTIDASSGLYTAPATTGTFVVTATQVGGTLTDTTSVQVR